MKITAELISAQEITKQGGCTEFNGLNWDYPYILHRLVGKRIEIKKYKGPHPCYDYSYIDSNGKNIYFKKSWLKDIREEMDWSEVKVDTKVIDSNGVKGYFAKYKPKYNQVLIFYGGKTSWSTNHGTITFDASQVKLAEEE